MPLCDEVPEYYSPDDDDEFPWDKPGWGDDGDDGNENIADFSTFQEARAWAKNNPGKTITRSACGKGFVKK